jgi:NAD(P)-dependent dehydrogenase (short-subunit alcohol dehydrogenase family)
MKTALVTGATRGLGAAIASALAGAGWKVFGTGRNPGNSREPFRLLGMDSRSDASVKAAVDEVLASEGRLDLLVACAGMGIAGPAEDSDMEDVAAQMDVNFMGTVRIVKACLPSMRSRGSGRIIVIGSLAGRTGMPFQAYYSASKFALEGFVESLRYELSPFGIEACIVEPGDFRTGFTQARKKAESADSPYAERFARTIAIQENDERNGADPALAARRIVRLAGCRKLPVRVSTGQLFQRAALFIKRMIPASWFEFFYRIYYRLG